MKEKFFCTEAGQSIDRRYLDTLEEIVASCGIFLCLAGFLSRETGLRCTKLIG